MQAGDAYATVYSNSQSSWREKKFGVLRLGVAFPRRRLAAPSRRSVCNCASWRDVCPLCRSLDLRQLAQLHSHRRLGAARRRRGKATPRRSTPNFFRASLNECWNNTFVLASPACTIAYASPASGAPRRAGGKLGQAQALQNRFAIGHRFPQRNAQAILILTTHFNPLSYNKQDKNCCLI